MFPNEYFKINPIVYYTRLKIIIIKMFKKNYLLHLFNIFNKFFQKHFLRTICDFLLLEFEV